MNKEKFYIKNPKVINLVEKSNLLLYLLSLLGIFILFLNIQSINNFNTYLIGLYTTQAGIIGACFNYICGLFFDNLVN